MKETTKKALGKIETKIETQLNGLKAKADIVKAKGEKLAANLSENYGKQFGDWQKKEVEIKNKLTALASNGRERFETLKSSTGTAMTEIKGVVEHWIEKNKQV